MRSLSPLLGKLNPLSHMVRDQKPKDNRAGQFVAVIECILNQNARDSGAAIFAGLNGRVVSLCEKYDVGILQMPCPEIAFLGFKRERPTEKSIRNVLDTIEGRQACRKISVAMIQRIESYILQGYRFLAILGGNPESPGCAVHNGDEGLLSISGVFMLALEEEFGRRHLKAPFRGIRDYDASLLEKDLRWLETVFSAVKT